MREEHEYIFVLNINLFWPLTTFGLQKRKKGIPCHQKRHTGKRFRPIFQLGRNNVIQKQITIGQGDKDGLPLDPTRLQVDC